MKTDKSKVLYDQLDRLTDVKVQIELQSGAKICGVFTGFYHGTRHFVERWDFHEVDPLQPTPSVLSLAQSEGITLKHEDLYSVFLFENQTHIYL